MQAVCPPICISQLSYLISKFEAVPPQRQPRRHRHHMIPPIHALSLPETHSHLLDKWAWSLSGGIRLWVLVRHLIEFGTRVDRQPDSPTHPASVHSRSADSTLPPQLCTTVSSDRSPVPRTSNYSAGAVLFKGPSTSAVPCCTRSDPKRRNSPACG